MLSETIACLESLLEAGGAVVDGDVHATDTVRHPPRSDAYYHGRPISAEDLIREMDLAGVAAANIWQNPAATVYPGGEDENAEALLNANAYIADAARKHPGRFIPSGWTDPKACGVSNARRIAEVCVREFGCVLVKMNPAQNGYPIDSEPVLAVADRIVELGAVPVFHYGADTPFTPPHGMENLARRYEGHPVLAVHMGGGGAGYAEAEAQYQASMELGLRTPHLGFVLSALRDNYIEEAIIRHQIAGPPFCQNLFFGSDAPYGRMCWNLGGFRKMLEGLMDGRRHPDRRVRANAALFAPEALAGYLGRNFTRMVLGRCRALAGVQRRNL